MNLSLFPAVKPSKSKIHEGKTTEKITRIDFDSEMREIILPFCRLKYGEIWEDPERGHRVGVLDAANGDDVKKIMSREKANLIINDPPYNVVVGNTNTDALFKMELLDYIKFSRMWVNNALKILKDDVHLYIWLGADYKDDFQPLPDFMLMMRDFKDLKPRNFITMRN
ncbi:site-specific DNA-methyltransferase, partial [bacterium]|nr:site-specific DNA-methyltransferase [bacterium]